METLCKLYLELANIVPPDCLSVRDIRLRGLLKEARQYIVDAGSDEDPETMTHSRALLLDIDKLLG